MARFFSSVLTIAAVGSVHAAPLFTRANDISPSFNVTRNALDAQVLNTLFGNLTMNSTCADSQMACVQNNVATCQDGAWQVVDQCNSQFQCLAMPELEGNGTSVECVSPKFAASVFNSAGVPGVNATFVVNASAVVFPTADDGVFDNCDGEDDGSSNSTTADKPSDATTTVTVTATPVLATAPIVTAGATTLTVNRSEASSIVQSILANGGAVQFSTSTVSPAALSTAASETGPANVHPTTIPLTAARPSATSVFTV
ncbi:hypothetical protein K488DRAFT_74451 [Vararia minispora EC-137]|uniref:Uncharacterized protein n=1 Tax=Vararia minispora EC-137 TaxID=1314806 RepID=A0ACB8Q6Z8_9AGAM|nr:hypothetical protein K488DRAFT_74451 [Vararia minispora EC-137]